MYKKLRNATARSTFSGLDSLMDEQGPEGDDLEVRAIITDAAAPVLRHINVNKHMMSDHTPESYEQAFRALL
jgi:hypothetical protein